MKPPVNGYRPRAEKEFGLGPENRRSNTMTGDKAGIYEGSSCDRLVYLATCLIGHRVEVQLKNGSVYTGICHTTNVENEFEIVLKMARLTKDVSSSHQKRSFVSKPPTKTFIIPGKEVMQVIAKDLPVIMDGSCNELQNEKEMDILVDSFISRSHSSEGGRELKPWVPDGDDPQCSELENTFNGPWNRGWDQFEANKLLFGVKSTFDEELYTTKLEKGPKMRDLEMEAIRIAKEIESEETQDLHLAEERGFHLHGNLDIDEESRYSSVVRAIVADGSGFEEAEDILIDSQNTVTFGGPSTAFVEDSADWTTRASITDAQILQSCSMDAPQYSQPNTVSDLYPSCSDDHARRLVSDHNESWAEDKTRNQDNMHGDRGNSRLKELIEEQPLVADAQLPKGEGSHSSQNGEKEGSDQGASNVTTSSLLHVSSKFHENACSTSKVLENTAVKDAVNMPSASSCGPSGVSSSNFRDPVACSASSGPGLSPSSSVGSLSSEKSTLNPHAKEFKLNPNAKSFTPQPHMRPATPVSDGPFYYPANMSGVPPLPGMPMGIGSFSGHQPVVFNPQMAPPQSPQVYFHPGGPPYGQQMLLGHQRPVMYMPGHRPEMQFKGRDY